MRIKLDDISLRAGERVLFAGTRWTLEPGQPWAILGPTGSGKSTLARAIARGSGLLAGQIEYAIEGQTARPYVYAHEIVTFSAETHRAFLQRFAEYHQARWQSFEGEDAPLVADLLEGGQPNERERIFALFGIEALLTRRAHQLSNGESRKVFLARLLLGGPRLVILDDPYTGLDQASRARLRAAIDGLLAGPVPAVLFVTSRIEELPPGVSHLLLVGQGRVVAQGERLAVEASDAFRELIAETNVGHSDNENSAPSAGPQTNALQACAAAYAAHLSESGVAPGQELVHLENVSISYPGAQVLRQVSWTVNQGERWALSGPNGAGKSTLLSLILADHPQAYRNRLRLFGCPRGSGESIWEIKRKIGWVSPELQIFYERPLTCFEAVCSGFFDSVGLYREPDEAQEAAARRWLAAFGLSGIASRPLLQLSAGQQRLVLLARALVKHPPLLVLDEPCQGLDGAQRRAFLDLLDALCAQTTLTLIYVSHDPREIPRAVTHHLRLDNGSVI